VVVLAAVGLPAVIALCAADAVGFHDDNSFCRDPEAADNLNSAENANTSIIHMTADWSQIAPAKPPSLVRENGGGGGADADTGSA
jgi:hypothetical protein